MYKRQEAAKKEFEDVSAVALDLFKGNSDSARRYVQQMIDEFFKLRVIKPLLQDVFGFGASSGFGGLGGFFQGIFGGGFKDVGGVGAAAGDALSSILGGAFSYEGGGYTGSGPRSGGLDGRGGYMAMLHPQETVIDHTKGQEAGATFAPVTHITVGQVGGQAETARLIARAIQQNNEQWRAQLKAAKVI